MRCSLKATLALETRIGCICNTHGYQKGICDGLERKLIWPFGGIQQAGAPKIFQLFLPAVIDDYKRSDTSFYSNKSWSRIGSLRQFRWFALKYFFGLYFKFSIDLQTLEVGVVLPRCSPWLRALCHPFSACGLQASAGIRDGAKFMCTSIR